MYFILSRGVMHGDIELCNLLIYDDSVILLGLAWRAYYQPSAPVCDIRIRRAVAAYIR